MKKLTHDEFLTQVNNINHNKYEFLSFYVNRRVDITFKCKDCKTIYSKKPPLLSRGFICQICNKKTIEEKKKKLKTKSNLIKQNNIYENKKNSLKKVHGDTYNYSLFTKYINCKSKIDIICNKHGTFKQQYSVHLRGFGCKKCQYERVSRKIRLSDNTINKRLMVKNIKLLEVYKGISKKHNVLHLNCNHITNQTLNDILSKDANCPMCTANVSKNEQEIVDFLSNELHLKVKTSDRNIIAPLELDIVVEEYKIAIEFNGLYWHSEAQGKDRNYHKNKTEMCKKAGYRLIHIYEDDYENKKDLILDFLRHIFQSSTKRFTYARKTKVKEIDSRVGIDFLDKYHIQGSGKGVIYLGSFLGEELISVTSFSKGASNTKNKGMYELSRHATSIIIIGCLGKVCKFFAKNYSNTIYTFCDDSMFNGESYIKAGFKEVSKIRPDYMYMKADKRYHKFNFRRESIKKNYPEVYDDNKSETEMMLALNFNRIWDCGKTRYEFMI